MPVRRDDRSAGLGLAGTAALATKPLTGRHIKGRRLLASTVWRDMVANRQTAPEAAEEWGIPVEAVEEAVRWCEDNRALLDMEAKEEARRLTSAGMDLARW